VKKIGKSLFAALLLCAPASQAFAQDAGDAAAGETVFKKCMACHRVGDGAKNLVGPQLNNVIGRAAGTAEGFRYSDINKHAGEAGLVWTPEHIVEYLPDPQGYLTKFLEDAGKADMAKGRTKMAYKLKDEKDRKDVVAYLQKFSEKK
jgi:cytochrome c